MINSNVDKILNSYFEFFFKDFIFTIIIDQLDNNTPNAILQKINEIAKENELDKGKKGSVIINCNALKCFNATMSTRNSYHLKYVYNIHLFFASNTIPRSYLPIILSKELLLDKSNTPNYFKGRPNDVPKISSNFKFLEGLENVIGLQFEITFSTIISTDEYYPVDEIDIQTELT